VGAAVQQYAPEAGLESSSGTQGRGEEESELDNGEISGQHSLEEAAEGHEEGAVTPVIPMQSKRPSKHSWDWVLEPVNQPESSTIVASRTRSGRL
jgi:hypothetical protein